MSMPISNIASNLLPWLIGAVIVLAAPGCQSASAWTTAGTAASRAAQTAKDDYSPSATATGVLRFGGAVLTLGGLAIVAARFLGALTAPIIGGLLTIGCGIAALTLADLMARYWWAGPAVLAALIVLAIIEYANDRNLLWKLPPDTPTERELYT